MQYDTLGNAYQNGPAVSSPGTGTWTTATVHLTGAQFDEAQNESADLRLNVADASVPLIVQRITMSVTGRSDDHDQGITVHVFARVCQRLQASHAANFVHGLHMALRASHRRSPAQVTFAGDGPILALAFCPGIYGESGAT